MTDVAPIAARAGPAQLTNMRLALQTLLAAQDAGEGSPRLCLFYGPSGYGKTVGAAYLAAQFEAAYVEAKSLWTARAMLSAIAAELGIAKPEKTAPRLLDQIIETLATDPRPLLIDEMDHVVRKGAMVEIIRDIHDSTTIPIMMIGEESLPAKLQAWERFDNRIIAATPAQPASIDDARRLREHYCLRAEIDDDLLAHIVQESKGVTRRIVVNLRTVQSAALDSGRPGIDLAWWRAQKRPLLTGSLPPRRKIA